MNPPKPPYAAVSRTSSIAIALVALLSAFILISAFGAGKAEACAQTSSGGLNMSSGKCKPFKKARLVNGKAIAPATAPARIKRVINWANRIRNKPYIWGGGHASFESPGYDCSGAVSYALRGGNFITSPMASGGYMNWKRSGRGKWLTVYSNPSHMYMVVAGLRFDTSMTPGNGPGWSKSMRSTYGTFSARHPAGF
jgi:hypothetical protein